MHTCINRIINNKDDDSNSTGNFMIQQLFLVCVNISIHDFVGEVADNDGGGIPPEGNPAPLYWKYQSWVVKVISS